MRRCFLLLLILFSQVFAGLRVEKVLDVKSIKEYNQWVKANRDRYPGLLPVYVGAERIEEESWYRGPGDWHDKYRIEYYDEDGNVVKEEIIEGWVSVKVIVENGRWLVPGLYKRKWQGNKVIIQELDDPISPKTRWYIVKSKNGKVIWKGNTLVHSLGERWCGISLGNNALAILDEDGNIQHTIYNITTIAAVNKFIAWDFTPDGRYGVITIGEKEDSDERAVILLGPSGKELWRKKISKRCGENAISDDGSTVAVGEKDKIYIYDRKGNLLKIYSISNPGDECPTPALSPDGAYLAVGIGYTHTLLFYDNQKGELLWQASIEDAFPPNELYVSDRCIVGIYPNGNVYCFSYDGNIIKKFSIVPSGVEWRPGGMPKYTPSVRVMIKDILLIRDGEHTIVYKIKE